MTNNEYKPIENIKSLKEDINKGKNLDKYKLQDFKFERAGNNTKEYFVHY